MYALLAPLAFIWRLNLALEPLKDGNLAPWLLEFPASFWRFGIVLSPRDGSLAIPQGNCRANVLTFVCKRRFFSTGWRASGGTDLRGLRLADFANGLRHCGGPGLRNEGLHVHLSGIPLQRFL